MQLAMRAVREFIVCAMLVLFALSMTDSAKLARAEGQVGTAITASAKSAELELNGKLSYEEQWWFNAAASAERSDFDGTLEERRFSIGAQYEQNPENSFLGGFSTWHDVTNGVSHIGPNFGYTRSWYEQVRSPSRPGFKAGAPAIRKNQVLGLSFLGEILFYAAESAGETTTTRNGRRGTSTAVTTTARSAVSLAQFHPSVELERPFLKETVIPYVSYGHYFYSQDPRQLETAISASSTLATTGAAAITAGLLRQSLGFGVSLYPVPGMYVGADLTLSQSATDETWGKSYGLTGTYDFTEVWRGKLGWNRWLADGRDTHYVTVGVAYLF